MKKIFTLAAISLFTILILSACTKRTYIDQDENYWLSKERGEVVYSSPSCSYYVVQTYNGYSVINSADGYRPFEGSILYGNFSNRGLRDIYNYTNDIIVTGDVRDYWLSYGEAQSAVDYYCYY
jgi:hypothetical protein